MDPQKLLELANVLAVSGASQEEIAETVKFAASSRPQRELTADERNIFSGSVARAVEILPAFRDAVALIRPFRDYTTPTLYTDRYSRVGIGTLFFLPSVSPYRRASLLLHEAMHILNNHFTRKVDFHIDPESDNNAKDLEINSILDRPKKTDLSMLLKPSQEPFRFPEAQSYEQYARMMKNKGLIPDELPQGSSPEASLGVPDADGQPSSQSESQESSGQKQEKSESGDQSGEPTEPGESSSSQEDSQDSESKAQGNGESDSQDSDSSESTDDSSSSGGDSSEDRDDSESDSEGNGSSSSSDSDSAPKDPESIAEQAMEGAAGAQKSDPSKPANACEHSTSEREKAADDLEIERASSSEQSVARNNTVARIREEASKSKARGDKAALMMLQQMELAMQPSKVDWRVIFRNIISSSRDAISLGRTNHTYRRVNKRLSTGEFIFPGMIRYEPSTIMAVDTSGSMSKEDYAFLLSELETIVKSTLRAKDRFKAFCVDAKATEPKTVRSIRDLDLRGGGGTKMEMAVRSIELLPKKEIPDIFILATDGGTSWPAFRRELLKSKHRYKTVVLITQTYTFESAKEILGELATVIDISQEGNGEISR